MPVTCVIKDNKVIVTLDLKRPPVVSSTGKTMLIACTHGGVPTEARVNGQVVKVTVSAYIPNR